MRSYLDAKIMAKALKAELGRRQIDIPHSQALELVAAQFDCDNWNVLAAKIAEAGDSPGAAPKARPDVSFHGTAPIFRIFDEAKAKEFYLDFLGFSLDWEHRFEPHLPLYAQVSRAGLVLHLSGHHGDASPGSTAFIETKALRGYQRELIGRDYPNMRPGIEEEPWGLVMTVIDPFSNNLRFCERL